MSALSRLLLHCSEGVGRTRQGMTLGLQVDVAIEDSAVWSDSHGRGTVQALLTCGMLCG